ncbi:MAG TPA: hypothetical protein VFR58_14175 [Flavisolibacter sp.]|nr:hypothetical protein [Flavisolibacter sp.]
MKQILFLTMLFCSMAAPAAEKKTILYASGKIQYEYELEGHLMEGQFSAYYESGRLKIKGQFRHNQKTGLWRVWDENGLLRSERKYSNNHQFVLINQWDASGIRIKEVKENAVFVQAGGCETNDELFRHHYLSIIGRGFPANEFLFEECGLADSLLTEAKAGRLTAYADDRMTGGVSQARLARYGAADITALKIKEEYACCAYTQSMNCRLMAICLVVTEDGVEKELGWFYPPLIKNNAAAMQQIRDHEVPGRVIATTVNDLAFSFRQVSERDSETARLMLFEMEASAILYTLDNRSMASSSH